MFDDDERSFRSHTLYVKCLLDRWNMKLNFFRVHLWGKFFRSSEHDVEKWTKYRFDGESWIELENCRKFSSGVVARTFHPANDLTFTRAKCYFIISCYSRCVEADKETLLAHKFMNLCKRSPLRGWKSNNHSTGASNGEQTTSHDLPLLYWHGMEILWVILCKHIFHFI